MDETKAEHTGNPVPPEAIRRELRKIIESELFRHAERQKRFLTYTVEQSLHDKGPALKETLLGVEVFDRKLGYDSQADNIVRVEARRIRAKLRAYYTNGGQRDPIVITYPVGSYAPVFAASASIEAAPVGTVGVRFPQWWLTALLVIAAAGMASFLVYSWSYRALGPTVVRVRIVAHRAEGQSGFVADTQRLFFVERAGNHWTLAQTPLDGGPVIRIPSPFKTPSIFDISADQAHLLIGGGESDHEQSLWAMPVAGGTPQRLDTLVAGGAAWSPDGRRLAYVLGPRLFAANADGSAGRAIARFPGDWLATPAWSPDQKRIRLTVIDPKRVTEVLWEVSADGSNPHPLLPGWKVDRACCGTWAGGGKYFIFSARVNGTVNLWAMDERNRLLHRAQQDPIQLTAGPVGLGHPYAVSGGKRLFAVNSTETGELVRYDTAKDAVEPYLGGISASWCSFSRDGQHVAYSSYPDHSLWRSKVDGSEAMQLTRSPMGVWASSWSPDGSRIAMMTTVRPAPARTYVVPADGGNPEPIIATPGPQSGVDFSPDGKSIVFGRPGNDPSQPDSAGIYLYNLESREVTGIPGSKGLADPSWSPDGRYIQAGDVLHGYAMTIWDFRTRTWKQILGPGGKHAPRWTRDSRHLIFESITDDDDAIYRVRVPDGRLEKIVEAKRFERFAVSHSLFSGLTPDESPLVMLFRNSFDISALDLEFR